MRAASWALSGRHLDRALGGSAAAILLRAIVACAIGARDSHFFGDGSIAGNLFFDSLRHPAFAAGMHLFVNGVIVAGFHLRSFGGVASTGGGASKHGAAGREAHGKGGESEEAQEFFHLFVGKIF